MNGILNGIRVLDFGRFIAGPWCGALLADLGAEVIRVEKIDGGEDRSLYPVSDEDGSGAMYLHCNRGKRGLTLNPLKPAGREIQEKLVATADMVLANMPPRALEQLGLDYQTLKAIKPDIILVTATAFGTTGPYAEKLGLDSVAQAMCGNMVMSGTPGQPIKSFSPWVDYNTATYAAFGALAALMHRNATGEGQEVQGALLATALTTSNSILIEQDLLKKDRVASGNRGQLGAPGDDVKTKDGHIFVTSAGQPMFERWVRLMAADGEDEIDWLGDPRFKDDAARGDNAEIVSERLARWAARRTTEEALTEMAEARIPAASVYTLQQTLDDPHVRESGMLAPTPYPGTAKDAPLAATPVRLTGTPGEVRGRAPLLGEHTDEILESLGYGEAEIERLRAERVV
ncbi:MAG: CoA transferase [Magnetovibrio sp.]|nr:CoA transferase [Magnetovibrio sp.]